MDFCGLDISCWINFFGYSFWQSFISDLLATFIGAGLGVWGALWLNKQQDRIQEKKEKQISKRRMEKVLGILRQNLLDNKVILEAWFEDHEQNNKKMVSVNYEVWTSFSNGNELQFISDLELIELLSNTYFYLKNLQMKTNVFFSVYFTTEEEKFTDMYQEIFPGSFERTLEHVDLALQKINEFLGTEI